MVTGNAGQEDLCVWDWEHAGGQVYSNEFGLLFAANITEIVYSTHPGYLPLRLTR